jgi:uncharacterized damage-inducible protein DinB
MSLLPEPWLRGPKPGVHALLAPLLYSFEQAREDLRRWTEGFSTDQVWASPQGIASVGFQIRHIGGSVERLMTYLTGRQLDAVQLAQLKAEMTPGASLAELLDQLEQKLAAAEAIVLSIDPAQLVEPREVGRQRLPTTVAGLLTHIAEHTQRHVGQAIVSAKLARSSGPVPPPSSD